MPWYVYFLCHPDTPDIPFYIGKGIGDRIDTHELVIRRGGYEPNKRKAQVIREIWAEGKQVVRREIASFEKEQDALTYEREMILSHKEHLTNSMFVRDFARSSGKGKRARIAMTQDKAVSINEAAQRLGVSARTVRRMIEAVEIHAFKVLGQWRIKESEIARIERGNQPQENQPQ